MSGDDWIIIRSELSVGDMRDLARSIRQAGSEPDYSAYPIHKAFAYLKSWSLVDYQGNPAPLSIGAIEMLQADTFTEISDAIARHESALEQGKKTASSAAASDRILQSVG